VGAVNQSAALWLTRTHAGRYHGRGAAHTYLIERTGDGWSRSITRAVVVADVQVSDPEARHGVAGHDGWLCLRRPGMGDPE
jgi:hypothetical protein